MKQIVIKKGAHTIYKWVPDDYVEQPAEVPQRDLTTSQACLIAFDIPKEDFNKIFHKNTP